MFSFFKKKKIIAHIKLNGVIGNAGKFKQGIDFAGQEEIIEKAFSLKKAKAVAITINSPGERGAIKIYEGQLLALNTFVKDENLKKKIEEMKIHEKEHCEYFENEIKKRNIKPTKFLPLWDLLGVGLGFGSTMLGKKAAMLCTASVEEVIDEHYLNQINELENDEKKLKEKIIKFREDELHHKDIAYKEGATKKGMYSILDKLIKTGSKIAINISEKI
ncbi:demethoxyubiquinone hydroxylase family protein [Candidatus Pelagibacter ubique]|nr:demethoxyubiquinone hydroxylase family protein [Candidatus Pelagibacter ubique]